MNICDVICLDIKGNWKPTKNPYTYLKKDDDRYAILDFDSGNVVLLNETAGKIFAICDGNHSEKDIIQMIQSEYGVSEEKAAGDASSFLKLLSDMKLVF